MRTITVRMKLIYLSRKTFLENALGYPWVLTPVEFTHKEQVMKLLSSRVIEPAEEKCKERQTLLDQLFNH